MENAFRKPLALGRAAENALAIPAFCLMTALAAFVRVPLPFTPVPLTLQTLAVLLSAAALGRKAVLSQAMYLALGAAGLPVFNGAAGGAAHLLGPTGGYLMGFAAAAFLAGWAAERAGRSLPLLAASMLLGSAVILAMGAGWLSVLMKLGPGRALALGVGPFVIGDLAKAGMAGLLAWGWKRR